MYSSDPTRLFIGIYVDFNIAQWIDVLMSIHVLRLCKLQENNLSALFHSHKTYTSVVAARNLCTRIADCTSAPLSVTFE